MEEKTEETKSEETKSEETKTEVTATTSEVAVEAKRPTFLTVLCILSYIGCAIQLLGSLGRLKTTLGIVTLLAAIICFVGVLMMWKLKKTGFYIYVVGEVVPIISGIIIVGASGLFSFAGGFMAMIMALSYIFPIAFLIMYGLNLKHLK